jgi:hypothetical protein
MLTLALLLACATPTAAPTATAAPDDDGNGGTGDDDDDDDTGDGGLVRGNYSGPPIYINEIMADRVQDPGDPSEGGDWIELYNDGGSSVELGGFFLDKGTLGNGKPWPLPVNVEIEGKGHLLIGCKQWEDEITVQADFSLDVDHDELYLYVMNADGTAGVADEVSWTGATLAPDSQARLPDGGDWDVSGNPTPGDGNRP